MLNDGAQQREWRLLLGSSRAIILRIIQSSASLTLKSHVRRFPFLQNLLRPFASHKAQGLTVGIILRYPVREARHVLRWPHTGDGVRAALRSRTSAECIDVG